MTEALPEKTAKQLLKDDVESMCAELQATFPGSLRGDEAERMIEQAQVLDKILLRMLADAEESQYTMAQFAIALRAQNQYRQTIIAADTLERRAAKQRDDEWEDYVENLKNPERKKRPLSISPRANYTDLPGEDY